MATDNKSTQQHLTVAELAERWKISKDLVRKVMLREPGILIFQNARPGRRTYRTIRIPMAIAERVYRRMTTDSD